MNTATAKQTDYLAALIKQRAGVPAAEQVAETARSAWRAGALSKPAASDFIKSLRSIPVAVVAVESEPETMTFEQYAEANEWWDGELSDAEARDDYARYVGTPEVAPNSCTPGQKCGPIDDLCTKHSAEYQGRWGRAANE